MPLQPNLFYSIVLYPLIFIFPAYVANGAPVLFGGGRPISKRIFGSHKTIKGLILGLLAGFIIAFIEAQFISYLLITGILLTIGTHVGDLLGSLIKRRIKIKEGQKFVIFDQYLFLLFALLFALPFGNFPSPYGMLFIIVLTGLLHVLTNKLAYKANVKKVPW